LVLILLPHYDIVILAVKPIMPIPEKIVAFLRGGKPGAFCDDCIKIGLPLPRRQEVAIVTLTPLFVQ
jgi:hypothetical protein